MGRIYKLLRAEYEELVADESLLVESPFAETTRDGRGLREVALGLTASKLIVAADNLGDNRIFWCPRNVDPSIESLELISVYPLEYITLTVFRGRKRKALQARLIDGRSKYYELGGLGCRARSWNDWCVQVERLLKSRTSETSACSKKSRTRRQSCDGWTRKHLYLGPEFEELWDKHYVPKPVAFARASLDTVQNDLISPRLENNTRRNTTMKDSCRQKVVRRVSRFAQGVDEKCQHALYIQLDQSDCQSRSGESTTREIVHSDISPAPHFLRGLGPWSIQPGDRVSLQSRLSQSLANVRRQDAELRLPVSKRQLAKATASLANLRLAARSVVLFWTPGYWYRPRPADEAYRDTRRHLDGLRNYVKCRRKFPSSHQRSTTSHLRRLLKPQQRVSLCDISSTTLSQQLTLIDRELFTRISVNEARELGRYRESRDAPNFAAWVAFAHRISCLLETELLSFARVDERSRILARLVRAADKCVQDGNFQSASSIVAAIQSPAVYRLKATWAYLESQHTSIYNTMTKLSKLFANTKTRQYHEAWMTAENCCRSSMPYVADVLARIIGLREIERKLHGDWKIIGLQWVSSIRLGLANPVLASFSNQSNRIDQVVTWLETCQSRALNYDYPDKPLAWEFLLKARYREDRENFLWSFNLETSG